MRPLCQTLSKPLKISRKIPLTSKPLSNDWQMSWIIDKSWYIHESPYLKSDWLYDIRSFLMKNSNKLLYIKRSNTFPHIGNNETGR